MFLEEKYVPPTTIESARMLTALYCVIMIQAVSRESMYKHNFGQTLELGSAVVNLNIRSQTSKSN